MERKKVSQNANFCRLIKYMTSTGADVLEHALRDVVFNCLLSQEKIRLKRACSDDNWKVSVSFEELYPSDGHLLRVKDFDELAIKEVFNMTSENITVSDFLGGIGLELILSSHRLKLKKHQNQIGEENWKKIDSYEGKVDIKNLDVSAMVFIIRYVFPKPSKRNWNRMPKEEDVSLEGDICRIYQYRNLLAHYRATKPITDSEFEKMWFALTCSFKRLARDPTTLVSDSMKLKSEAIGDLQKYEDLVDAWVVEEFENVEILKRHISLTQEDSAERVVREVSSEIEKAVTTTMKHTKSIMESKTKEIREHVNSVIEETLTQLKENEAVIVEDATGALNTHIERSAQVIKDEVRNVITDSLGRVGSDIETKISDVVKDEVAEMSSAIIEPVKQEVGSIMTNCFGVAVNDIEKKVENIVNDKVLRMIESLLGERAEQVTTFIINKVQEEVIKSSKSGILDEFIQNATRVISENLAEDSKKHLDQLHQQYAHRHGDSGTGKCVQPTGAMDILVQAWHMDDQDFFVTHAYTSIENSLESQKHLTIIGPPLSGKTMIVRHIALHMRRRGYTVFPISADPSEIDRFLSEEGKQIFIIDDPLGKNSIDMSMLAKWRTFDERLRMLVKKDNLNVKVVWVMNSQQAKEDVFRTSGLIFTENKVDITRMRLSSEERNGIAAKHLKRIFFEDKDAYVKVLDVAASCDYFFFPKICSELHRISKWQQSPEDPFQFPFEVLVDYFDHIPYSNKHQFTAMGLCAILGKLPFDLNSLQCAIKEGARHMECNMDSRNIKSALQSMTGIWFKRTKEHFEFCHEIYRDVILFLMGKHLSLDPSVVLMNLSCHCIRERVRYNPDLLEEIPEKYVFELEKKYWQELSFHICHDLLHSAYRKDLQVRQRLNEDASVDQYKSDVLKLLKTELSRKDFLAITALSIQTENAEMLNVLIENQPSGAINFLFDETKENSKMDVVGLSPLHFAVSRSSHWGIDKLCQGGADINQLSKEGLTPLNLAVEDKNLPMVSELIKFGADLNIPFNNGLRPVHFAIEQNCVEMVSMLVESKADMEVCTPDGQPPIHVAIQRNNDEMVKKLLELGIDTNICNEEGKAALNFALEQSEPNVAIVEMLVNCPKTDVTSSGGLHIAVISNNVHLLNVLLDSRKFDVNCTDEMKSTPLHIAARNNYVIITTLLLTSGADTTLTDKNKKTPWQIANDRGNDNLAEIIQRNE